MGITPSMSATVRLLRERILLDFFDVGILTDDFWNDMIFENDIALLQTAMITFLLQECCLIFAEIN